MGLSRGKILVIDEDARAIEALSPIFSRRDYEVVWAGSGDDGIRLAEVSEPDVILVDLHLTDMRGLDVCRNLRLRNSTWSIPIILVADALADEAELIRGLELGANDCVTKPFRATELLGRVGVLMRVKRVEDKLRRLYVERTKELEWSNMELQKIRTQLILKSQMSTLGLMVAVAAHEIRSPAASISGNLELTSSLVRDFAQGIAAVTRALLGSPEDLARFHQLLQAVTEVNLEAAPREVLERRQELEHLRAALEQQGLPLPDEQFLSQVVKFRMEAHVLPLLELTRRFGSLIVDTLTNLCELIVKHKNMQISIHRINAMVRAMKGYSHIDRAELQELDVHTGLEDTLTIMNYIFRGSVEVRREYAADLPTPLGHPGELNQVWTNLLQNAFDALEDEPRRITVRTECLTRRARKFVGITFEDTGKGIPREILPNIFDSFFTTKDKGKGSGLGLDICKQIIEKHQGLIEVESIPGRTTVRVLLPAERSREGQKIHPEIPRESQLESTLDEHNDSIKGPVI